MATVPIDLSDAITAGANTLGTLIGGAVTQGYNRENMELQNEYAKELMNYQWQHFNSYKAQVDSMREAGLNPAVLYGKGASSAASPSPSMPSSAPINVPSVFDLGSLSNYMLSVAQAKKAGMDTKLSEQEIKNKEVERQRNDFELKLRQEFGKDIQTADLANAYMQLVLASDNADLNEQQKALNTWRIASEKAISQANEYNRDILKQNLANNPTKIKLENNLLSERSKSEQASQAASYASASESSARAKTENELRSYRITSQRLENALKDVQYSVASLTRLDTVQQVRDEAARVHKMLMKGDVLGKWLPQLEGTEIRVPVLSDVEDALMDLWLKYKHGVEVGKQNVESRK